MTAGMSVVWFVSIMLMLLRRGGFLPLVMGAMDVMKDVESNHPDDPEHDPD